MTRRVFLVSDHTGITAETLLRALLSQFPGLGLRRSVHPFVDTMEKVDQLVLEINAAAAEGPDDPLVLSSVVDDPLRQRLRQANARVLDIFDWFLSAFSEALGEQPAMRLGASHGMGEPSIYDARVEAMNYALDHDDGVRPRDLDQADVILIGVSRAGKTPTALYLALQYGLRAANYPLTEEDMGREVLPQVLMPYRDRLFGLTISAERLHEIRQKRRPDSSYASLAQCRRELAWSNIIFTRYRIPFLDSTSHSVEEIATGLVHRLGLRRS